MLVLVQSPSVFGRVFAWTLVMSRTARVASVPYLSLLPISPFVSASPSALTGTVQGIPRLNTVFLTGYLGQDPKPKYFDSGKVVLNLSLAVKREYHPIEVRFTCTP